MPKLKLHIDYDYDFSLLGIICAEKPYRLCWALNQQLKASFCKAADKEVKERSSEHGKKFEVFFFRDEGLFTDYRVIANKSGNSFFVPEYKQADYLLMIQGEIPVEEKNAILQKIKEVNFIQTVFEIDPKRLKARENFLF